MLCCLSLSHLPTDELCSKKPCAYVVEERVKTAGCRLQDLNPLSDDESYAFLPRCFEKKRRFAARCSSARAEPRPSGPCLRPFRRRPWPRSIRPLCDARMVPTASSQPYWRCNPLQFNFAKTWPLGDPRHGFRKCPVFSLSTNALQLRRIQALQTMRTTKKQLPDVTDW